MNPFVLEQLETRRLLAFALEAIPDFNFDDRRDIDDWGAYDLARYAAKPNAENTGPRNRAALVERPAGTWTISQPGVYSNFRLRGQIVITANNVTLRDFEIYDPSTTGAAIKFSSNDLVGGVVEFGEIHGGTATNGVSGSNYHARRLHIHHMRSDCFRVKVNVTIEACYLHDFGIGEDSHGDGVQMYPTGAGSGNIRILGNTMDARGANAALFQVNGGWFIAANFFDGGNYTIQCGGEVGNIFIDNVFGRSSKYGPIRVGSGDRDLLTWENNRDTAGQLLEL
jgi:hypothetical protein